MTATQLPSLDKNTARALIEHTLKRLGVQKGELAAVLSISAGGLSRRLGARYPFDVFSEAEINRIADYLELSGTQRQTLLRCYGYGTEDGSRPGRWSSGSEPATRANSLTQPPSARGPANLPVALTSFVGRARERREVAALLRDTRLLTLTGAGGSGKTRLALAVAEEVREQYADGVWLVELAGLTDPLLLPQIVAAALEVHDTTGRPPLDLLIDRVRRRRLLLVLDNCEHLIDGCAQLAMALLVACPDVRILATSRETLGVPGEVAWPAPPMSLAGDPRSGPPLSAGTRPEPVTPPSTEGAEHSDAALLFIERARTVRPGFAPSEADVPAIAEICRQVDGLPLAIELAAANLKLLTVAQLAALLAEGPRLLTGGSRTAPARHQTLRATIDWSYDRLTGPEQTLLRRLSVFAGGFDLEAVEAVCGEEAGEGLASRSGVVDGLLGLVNKSLLVVDDREAVARYRLLEPIRQYAREKLEVSGATDGDGPRGDAARSQARHLRWCVDLAERAEPGLWGPHQQEWRIRLRQELENIRVALGSCGARDDRTDEGLRLAAALTRFWELNGLIGEGRAWLAAGLTRGGRIAVSTRTKALIAAARLAHRQGGYAAAGELAEEALALAQERSDRRQIAAALLVLGSVAHVRGDYPRALALLEETRTVAEAAGDRVRVAAALGALGLVARARGDFPAARALFEQSLALWRAIGDRAEVAGLLNGLGLVADGEGDFAAARAFYEESLSLRRELNDRLGIAASLGNIGGVMQQQGEYDEARALHEQNLAIVRDLGDRRGEAVSLINLAVTIRGQGDNDDAAALFEQALALMRELGDRRGSAITLNHLGNDARTRGDYDAAGARYAESLEIARELGDAHSTATALGHLGRLAVLRGELRQAYDLLAEGLAIWRSMANRASITGALERFAELACAEDRPEQAARLFGAAEALREATGVALPPHDQPVRDAAVAATRARLGETALAAAWAGGRAMTLDAAVALAAELGR